MTDLFKDLFREYEQLAEEADRAFSRVEKDYGAEMKCAAGCSDCCHSVFGLFLIESVYINHHFQKLDRKTRREAAPRLDRADRDLLEVERRLSAYDHDPGAKALAMAGERVRCPLLGRDDRCVLYARRPITCRVYGIPTVTGGVVRACWKAGFEKGRRYPVFDLDGAYRRLYRLSARLLERCGQRDTERASLLLSVSRSIKTPVEELPLGGVKCPAG
ncbi:MAG: YkgJ family cysteine cluster protein [Firmicutes bacterium]|nr:YkgJ family cysteine cluster protein [Bacillota bacterium]